MGRHKTRSKTRTSNQRRQIAKLKPKICANTSRLCSRTAQRRTSRRTSSARSLPVRDPSLESTHFGTLSEERALRQLSAALPRPGKRVWSTDGTFHSPAALATQASAAQQQDSVRHTPPACHTRLPRGSCPRLSTRSTGKLHFFSEQLPKRSWYPRTLRIVPCLDYVAKGSPQLGHQAKRAAGASAHYTTSSCNDSALPWPAQHRLL